MTVTAKANDTAGVALDAKNTALAASISAAVANSTQLAALTAAQAQLQTEIIHNHFKTGRLSGASILAASIFGPTGASALSIPASDIATTALNTNITALAAKTATPYINNLLEQNRRELVAVCIAKGYLTQANVLASSL